MRYDKGFSGNIGAFGKSDAIQNAGFVADDRVSAH